MARADFRLNTYLGGTTIPFNGKAEEGGGITEEGLLYPSFAADIDSGGTTVDAVFNCVDDEEFSVGDRVSFWWASGVSREHGGTVTVSAANQVTVTGFDGALPIDTTSGKLTKVTEFSTAFDGDDLACIAASCDAAAVFLIREAINLNTSIDLVAGLPWWWMEDMGFTNPVASDDIAFLAFVMYDAVGTEKVKIGIVLDDET